MVHCCWSGQSYDSYTLMTTILSPLASLETWRYNSMCLTSCPRCWRRNLSAVKLWVFFGFHLWRITIVMSWWFSALLINRHISSKCGAFHCCEYKCICNLGASTPLNVLGSNPKCWKSRLPGYAYDKAVVECLWLNCFLQLYAPLVFNSHFLF